MGQPKLLLPWGETTVIGHIIDCWRGLGATRVAVVLRPDDHALRAELERLNLPAPDLIPNPFPERGMFSSILCAARHDGWEESLASFALALGDQPQLPRETLRALLQFHRTQPDSICQPLYGGHGRHPVILPRADWKRLAQSPAATLKEFLAASSVLECPIDDARLTLDLDTPEDYKKLVVRKFDSSQQKSRQSLNCRLRKSAEKR